MPRGHKILIDEKIKQSEAALAKAKSRYDAEAAVLKELLQKRQSMRDQKSAPLRRFWTTSKEIRKQINSVKSIFSGKISGS